VSTIRSTVVPIVTVSPGSRSRRVIRPSNGASRVARIAWEADRQTHELLVEVALERIDRRVAIGQRADVRIELARHEQVLRVPTRMLHHDATGPYVYVDRGGKIALARPRLGLTGAEEVEVLEGLADGDVVLGAPGTGAALAVGRRWKAR